MLTLTPAGLTELKLKANDVRQGIIRSLLAAGSGHSAGPLDMADVFTALYGHLMRHDPHAPEWPRSRPSAALLRTHRPGALLGDGELRVLSGRRAADAAQVRDATAGPPRTRSVARPSKRRRVRSAKGSRKASAWRSARRWTARTFASGSSPPMPSISAACIGRRC